MKKTLPLKITVSSPCSENWTAMKEKGEGRFCEHCKKVVIDFTGLSDKELYNYFRQAKYIPCGRFHASQLNKDILPEKKPWFPWKNFYKAAATLLAFSSLKYSGATGSRIHTTATVQPALPHSYLQTGEKIIISGTVKDKDGNALENAEISIEGVIVAKTGTNGKFEFQIPENQEGKAFLLVISYPDKVSIVRNYHPGMQSASYDISFLPPPAYYTCCTMGFPAIYFPATVIPFKKGDKTLSNETKTALTDLVDRMINNPEIKVNMTGNEQTAKKYLQFIKKYLTDEKGISDDRLTIIMNTQSPKNTIEISKSE